MISIASWTAGNTSIVDGLSAPFAASTPTGMTVRPSSVVWLKSQEELEVGCARHSTRSGTEQSRPRRRKREAIFSYHMT